MLANSIQLETMAGRRSAPMPSQVVGIASMVTRAQALGTHPTLPHPACDRLLAPRLSPPAPCLLCRPRAFIRLGRPARGVKLRGGRDDPTQQIGCAQCTLALRCSPRDCRSGPAIALRLLMLRCVCPLTRALCVLLLRSCRRDVCRRPATRSTSARYSRLTSSSTIAVT